MQASFCFLLSFHLSVIVTPAIHFFFLHLRVKRISVQYTVEPMAEESEPTTAVLSYNDDLASPPHLPLESDKIDVLNEGASITMIPSKAAITRTKLQKCHPRLVEMLKAAQSRRTRQTPPQAEERISSGASNGGHVAEAQKTDVVRYCCYYCCYQRYSLTNPADFLMK